MPHKSVILQYTFEVNAWKRLLAFFLVENIYFKTRLAELLNSKDDEDVIENGEKFQDEFLSQDRILSFLDSEVKRQTKLLERDLYEDGELFKGVVKNQKKLRKDIKSAEGLFTKLKETFSNYLSAQF
jgi:hypothetical protein